MKSTLFVGDLSSSCSEKDLETAFSIAGPVRHVRIQRAQNTQISLGYGFVKMASSLNAYKAITLLNGYILLGRKLRVRFAAYRVGANESKMQPTNCLYFKFSGQTFGAMTDESKIRELYSVFGTLEDVNIRKMSYDKVSK